MNDFGLYFPSMLSKANSIPWRKCLLWMRGRLFRSLAATRWAPSSFWRDAPHYTKCSNTYGPLNCVGKTPEKALGAQIKKLANGRLDMMISMVGCSIIHSRASRMRA